MMGSIANNQEITQFKNKPLKKQSTLLKLLKFTKPYLKEVVIAIFLVLLVNVAQLLKPIILKLVIDDFLVARVEQSLFYSITSMAVIYFVLVLSGGIFSILQTNLINKVSQSIMKEVRARVFRVIQYLPLKKIDSMSSGRLITRATNDVEALNEMYTDVLINLFKDIFLLIGILAAMLSLNVSLSLISFCLIPIMVIWMLFLKKKIKDNFSKMKQYIGKINGFMAENISGMKIVQIYRGEKEKVTEFLGLNEEYFKTTIYQVKLNSILRPATDVFQTIAVAILIGYSMNKIADFTLEIGVLYAFTTYIRQFFGPISDLAENYTTIQSALVSADRIFELLDEEGELENIKIGQVRESIKGDIEFKHVWFAYQGEDWILKDVSFKLKAGETAAFVGETGAGKSTIISLISGFYPVTRGEILIDGINIKSYPLEHLRKQVVVVLQDVFLFSGTIRENIALNDEIKEEQIQHSLKLSCAEQFVSTLTHQIEEPVMERGSTFSAGQKQLLSFARALAHDPAILVLDEATANIDTQTEMLIQTAIENSSQNRTTLIIAHRLSTIRNANQIIVLRKGEIQEIGNHDELLQRGGYYAHLIKSSKDNITVLS